jgi:very-short-patch-repair endonuclease
MASPRGIVRGQRVNPEKLARAKALRREMTPQEQRLWAYLRKNQLAGLHFRRQQVADGFLLDFYCNAAGLVVELDGPIHEDQRDYDAERDRWLAARGLHILRFSNAEIEAGLDAILARIAAACRDRLGGELPHRRPEARRE